MGLSLCGEVLRRINQLFFCVVSSEAFVASNWDSTTDVRQLDVSFGCLLAAASAGAPAGAAAAAAAAAVMTIFLHGGREDHISCHHPFGPNLLLKDGWTRTTKKTKQI